MRDRAPSYIGAPIGAPIGSNLVRAYNIGPDTTIEMSVPGNTGMIVIPGPSGRNVSVNNDMVTMVKKA